MREDSRRSRAIGLVICAGFSLGLAAQQPSGAPAPESGATSQGAAPQSNTPSPQGSPNGGATGTTLDYLYNRKPGDGSAAQGGAGGAATMQQKAMAADMLSGAENLIPPELESYLNSAEVDAQEVKAYEDLFKQTVNLLRDKRQAAVAVGNLYTLSEYPWDAGISRQLANRVLSFWDMRNNQAELDAANRRFSRRSRLRVGMPT